MRPATEQSVFWKDRRVLVTGTTGMVGSWLVKDLLARNAYVVALIRDTDPHSELYRSRDIERIGVVNGPLEEFATIERAINENEIDTIIHLGAQTIVGTAHRFPLGTFEANIRGTYNLLEAARIHRDMVQRVVIASSDKAYGESVELPYLEDMPLQGRYPYEVSKSCADLIAQSYYHTYGMPVAITRCGNVYGGGDQNWSRIVPGTVRSFLRGERPLIRSNGLYVRDYIYVKDISRAYLKLAECLDRSGVPGNGFNFSAGSPLTVLEIVRAIQRLMDCGDLEPMIQDCASAEIHSQYLCSQKASETLQWTPEYRLEEGLRETIAWYSGFFCDSALTPASLAKARASQ